MPGPLSSTVMPVRSTVTVISGAMPASSPASSALSTSSLTITSGQLAFWWPVCAISSFSDAKSSSRLVRKVARERTRACDVMLMWRGLPGGSSRDQVSPRSYDFAVRRCPFAEGRRLSFLGPPLCVTLELPERILGLPLAYVRVHEDVKTISS